MLLADSTVCFEFTQNCELEVITGVEDDEPVTSSENFHQGSPIEVDLLEDEDHSPLFWSVQFWNGDVTHIPKEFVVVKDKSCDSKRAIGIR